MRFREALSYLLPTIWTFLPMYGVERLADYYFLIDNPAAFYAVSGWRLELFIIFVILGSVGAGLVLREIWRAIAVEGVALLAFLLAVYSICDPRVCFSTGSDGLEPLRLGFFLVSVAISGAALGVASRHAKPANSSQLLAGIFGFAALGFFPIVFTFAGTRLLPPFHPWAAACLLALGAFGIALLSSLNFGPRIGFLLPLVGLASLLAVSAGIASAYLTTIEPDVVLISGATVVSAALGAGVVRLKSGFAHSHRREASGIYSIALLLVLVVMLYEVPDAVVGVVPSHEPSQSFTFGAPVYAGAYMDAAAGHALGAGVTVGFAGTDPSAIQPDNFLSAGMGIHAAGCCVDGIDYSYRFDLYLFHGGQEALLATAWEACDDNAACGGHSWKVLMFLRSQPLMGVNLTSSVDLRMAWERSSQGPEVVWTYSTPGGSPNNFTSFLVPRPENPDFNTGLLTGGTLGPEQSGSYFFQFGVMSAYPIGHPGWAVLMRCPAILTSDWRCVEHARTLTGAQSFWKVFWRWGESYPNVSEVPLGSGRIAFGYSSNSTGDNQKLW